MGMITATEGTTHWLLCRAGEQACGLPLEAVLLTLRRPTTSSWTENHELADGVATIRGELVPVVSLSGLLRGARATREAEARLVLLSVAGRKVGLGVTEVLGVRALPSLATAELPPLLADDQAEHVARVGLLDGELLVLLRTGRLLPDAPHEGHMAGEGQA